MSRTSTTVAVLTSLAVLLTGCRDDGRSLDPAPSVPVSLETTTTTTTTGPVVSGDDGVGGLSLTSPAFADGGSLPSDHTCDGIDVPPPLVIGDVPDGTTELAIVVTARDPGATVHWVVAGIPPTVTRIEPGILPSEAVTARATSGLDGWDGPCPPPGDPAQTYDFAAYAMIEPLGLAPDLEGRAAIGLIDQAAAATGLLSATYASPAEG